MNGVMPAGRRLQLGTYWSPLWSFNAEPSTDYDDRLMTLAFSQPSLGGVSAYAMQADPGVACDSSNHLESAFCTLRKVYNSNDATLMAPLWSRPK
jgi:hypothetical protein